MKRLASMLLALLLVLSCVVALAEGETEAAKIVSAKWVTQVLEWGETVTGVCIEYDDEVYSGDLQASQFPTYVILTNRACAGLYCNNSGKLGDAQAWGKYVFYEFAIPDDFVNYTDYIVFNENSKNRDKISSVYLEQMASLRTKNGKVAPQAFVTVKDEIRYDIDKFMTVDHPYVEDDTEQPLQYHLYIPEGIQDEKLPLIVHFGHDSYQDYTGNYYGTLIAHNECTIWASDEFQARHPAYVLTLSGLKRPSPAIYKEVIDKVCQTYPIDMARIYGVTYAGSTGNFWAFIKEYPDVLAAGITAATHVTSGGENQEQAYITYKEVIATLPMWCFNGLNDLNRHAQEAISFAEQANAEGIPVCLAYGENGEHMWNGLLRGDAARALAEKQIAEAEAMGTDDLVTMYVPNTILFTDHWAWTAVMNNPGIQDWLLEQVNEAPYTIQQ